MKKIGLIGGMSWESSLEYYRILNEITKERLGDTHSARCILFSFDFWEIEQMQHRGEWEKLTDRMVEEAINLKNAGAEFIVICTNTMHIMANEIEEKTELKVLHIAKVTGEAVAEKQLNKVALLGTDFTMTGTFYRDILSENNNIEVIIPDENDRKIIHDTIYNELIFGTINPDSKKAYIEIINKLEENGAEGIILGCTEIPLLIKQEDVNIPVFDTTFIHAKSAVDFAIDN
jgi:aspartate racemase